MHGRAGPMNGRTEDRWAYEKGLWAGGHDLLAGVDEAGRGPLAGPVVAAAVILPRSFSHQGVRDSKLLSAGRRAKLAAVLREEALSWAVAVVEERQIERINILQATLLAMKLAVEGLDEKPGHLLVDAVHIPDMDIPQLAIIKGDNLSVSISAASIIAKVERDCLMNEYHDRFPEYNFRKNKGYGTVEHRRAIRDFGPCPAHRRTFRGVREFLGS